jgi:cell division protein FtsL
MGERLVRFYCRNAKETVPVSLLNKIFIVLLVVESIAVGVTIPLVLRDVTRPAQQVAELQSDLNAVVGAVTAKTTIAGQQINELRSQKEKANLDANAALEDAASSRAKGVDLAGELKKASEKGDALSHEVKDWSDKARIYEIDWQKAIADRDAARTDSSKMTSEYQKSLSKLTEASAQRDFLLQENKVLREKISMLEKQQLSTPAVNASATGSGSEATPMAGSMAAATTPPIKGVVKAVADNMTLATIDVGANDGVTAGMEFTVFRKGTFVATLVITSVDAKTAVGRLEKVQNRVQLDDKAWTQLSAN